MPTKKKKNDDECIQLKNINYQSMLLKRNSNIDSQRGGTDNIEKYLEQEQNKKKTLKPWSKLEKTTKLKKIYTYTESNFHEKYKMTEEEQTNLKKYMRTCLERKKLQRIKDVVYDTQSGIIKNIPGLTFNEKNRKFVLRKIDKKGSTLRNLAPKNSSRGKTKKKTDKKNSEKKKDKKDKKKKKSDRKKSEKKNRKIKNKTNKKIDKHLKE